VEKAVDAAEVDEGAVSVMLHYRNGGEVVGIGSGGGVGQTDCDRLMGAGSFRGPARVRRLG